MFIHVCIYAMGVHCGVVCAVVAGAKSFKVDQLAVTSSKMITNKILIHTFYCL